MPRKSKQFIDKKNAITFHVISKTSAAPPPTALSNNNSSSSSADSSSSSTAPTSVTRYLLQPSYTRSQLASPPTLPSDFPLDLIDDGSIPTQDEIEYWSHHDEIMNELEEQANDPTLLPHEYDYTKHLKEIGAGQFMPATQMDTQVEKLVKIVNEKSKLQKEAEGKKEGGEGKDTGEKGAEIAEELPAKELIDRYERLQKKRSRQGKTTRLDKELKKILENDDIVPIVTLSPSTSPTVTSTQPSTSSSSSSSISSSSTSDLPISLASLSLTSTALSTSKPIPPPTAPSSSTKKSSDKKSKSKVAAGDEKEEEADEEVEEEEEEEGFEELEDDFVIKMMGGVVVDGQFNAEDIDDEELFGEEEDEYYDEDEDYGEEGEYDEEKEEVGEEEEKDEVDEKGEPIIKAKSKAKGKKSIRFAEEDDEEKEEYDEDEDQDESQSSKGRQRPNDSRPRRDIDEQFDKLLEEYEDEDPSIIEARIEALAKAHRAKVAAAKAAGVEVEEDEDEEEDGDEYGDEYGDEEEEDEEEQDEFDKAASGREDLSRYSSLVDEFISRKQQSYTEGGSIITIDSDTKSMLKTAMMKQLEQLAADEEDETKEDLQLKLENMFQYREAEEWDAESIVSTYSNLENHPTKIREVRRNPKKVIQLSSKSGMPVGAWPERRKRGQDKKEAGDGSKEEQNQAEWAVVEKDEEEEEEDNEEETNLGVARPLDESAADKKARKQAAKAAKREQRSKKKQLKGLYSVVSNQQHVMEVRNATNNPKAKKILA